MYNLWNYHKRSWFRNLGKFRKKNLLRQGPYIGRTLNGQNWSAQCPWVVVENESQKSAVFHWFWIKIINKKKYWQWLFLILWTKPVYNLTSLELKQKRTPIFIGTLQTQTLHRTQGVPCVQILPCKYPVIVTFVWQAM